ncbi:MAG: TRAP transporter large permease [Pseudomonadota bacterium]
MSPELIGILGIVALFVLLALRMPVAVALMIVGTGGIALLSNSRAALATLGSETFVIATKIELTIIPLFVLMGNLASQSGLSRNLYDAAYAWVGHWRGGLASATVVGCSGFAALSGSSVASAITMGRVALPEMKRYEYDNRLATGSVAAGGTLGILIPPSTGFVIYAILTEESIGRLFMAGILPGLLLTGLFIVTITLLTMWRPSYGPAGPQTQFGEKLIALAKAGPLLAIIAITIGGIYGGVFSPMEAAGVGALLTLAVALYRRSLTWGSFGKILLQTVRISAMSYLILIGAHVFSPFLARTDIPGLLTEALIGLGLGSYGTLIIILVAFIILGTFLEGFAMLVLTLPIVFPLILALGFDPIWFGVIMVIVLEMGLITPPVGVNVFVVKSIAPGVPMGRIFAGIAPFWFAMLACLIILLIAPQIVLLLPDTMFG